MLELAFSAVMVLNLLWFSMAFHYFSLKAGAAAKMLVPKPQRESPLFETLVYSVRFLGGMNFAFAFLSLLLLFNLGGFDARQQAWMALLLAVAHASQFCFNLPLALKRQGMPGSDQPGLTGPMRLIFVVDGTLMLANAVLGVLLAFC